MGLAGSSVPSFALALGDAGEPWGLAGGVFGLGTLGLLCPDFCGKAARSGLRQPRELGKTEGAL